MKFKAVLILSTLIVLLAISQAYGVKEVYPKYGTLKNIIKNAKPGETIFLHKGTYHASGIVVDKNLTIVGEDRDGVVIDALGQGPIFIISSGANARLINLTLTNGYGAGGGAIDNNGYLVVKNCAFVDNYASEKGGAIFNNGTLTINGCRFKNNKVIILGGGAIYNSREGQVTISNSVFVNNNAAVFGGAIDNDGYLTIKNCVFENNTAFIGGAIYNNGDLTIIHSTFINNGIVRGFEGTISNNGNLTIIHSTFDGKKVSYKKEKVTMPTPKKPPIKSSFDYFWVTNTDDGSVSKVDKTTMQEVARYRVNPNNNTWTCRIAVDKMGNAWIVNTNVGTVVKILGNTTGLNNTSTGPNDIKPWGQDQAVQYEIVLIPGKEGTYKPGTYTGGYDPKGKYGENGAPSPRAIAVDKYNNVWVGTYGTQMLYYINGSNGQIIYKFNLTNNSIHNVSSNFRPCNAIIDENGYLWITGDLSGSVLRVVYDYNNDTVLIKRIDEIPLGGNVDYAYAIASDHKGRILVTTYSKIIGYLYIIDSTTGSILRSETLLLYQYPTGIVVDDNGNIWIACYYGVIRLASDGRIKAIIRVGYWNTGVGIIKNETGWKIVVTSYKDNRVYTIDPNTNKVDNSVAVGPCGHYMYGDFTGYEILRTLAADLSIVKNASATTARLGDRVTFTITVMNNGPNNATDVNVTDKLPSGLEFVGCYATKGTYNPTSGTWNFTNLINLLIDRWLHLLNMTFSDNMTCGIDYYVKNNKAKFSLKVIMPTKPLKLGKPHVLKPPKPTKIKLLKRGKEKIGKKKIKIPVTGVPLTYLLLGLILIILGLSDRRKT